MECDECVYPNKIKICSTKAYRLYFKRIHAINTFTLTPSFFYSKPEQKVSLALVVLSLFLFLTKCSFFLVFYPSINLSLVVLIKFFFKFITFLKLLNYIFPVSERMRIFTILNFFLFFFRNNILIGLFHDKPEIYGCWDGFFVLLLNLIVNVFWRIS